MNETVSYEAAEVLDETQSELTDDFGKEVANENWDFGLTNLVAQYAHVVVRCSWLGGAEVTLGTAMVAYPVPITPENVHSVIAEVYQLLANQVTETEEAQEEVPEEEPENQKPAEEKAVQKETVADVKKEQAEPGRNEIEKPTQGTISEPSLREVVRAPETPSQSHTAGVKPRVAEPVVSSPSPVEKTVTMSISNRAAMAPLGIVHGIKKIEPLAAQTVQRLMPPLRVSRLSTLASIDLGERLPDEKVDEAQPSFMNEPRLNNNGDNLISAETDIEVGKEEPSAIIGGAEVIQPGDQSDTDVLGAFIEGAEVIINHHEASISDETDQTAWKLTQVQDYQDPLTEVGIDHRVQLVEASVAIEQVRDCMARLEEQIASTEPEVSESAEKILSQIIEVSEKLEISGSDGSTAEGEEKLKVLYTELLGVMGTSYTPELVESLVKLTIKWQATDKFRVLTTTDNVNALPADVGTHEAITELLIGLSSLNMSMARAYALGKSAIRLYSFSLAA